MNEECLYNLMGEHVVRVFPDHYPNGEAPEPEPGKMHMLVKMVNETYNSQDENDVPEIYVLVENCLDTMR